MSATRIIIDHPGGPEVLRQETYDPGAPGPGEALVRHEAIGLNFIDTHHRSGRYPLPSYPSPLSLEAAGIVEQIGPGVTTVAPGDRVAYATMRVGAYADRRVVPVDRHSEDEIARIAHAGFKAARGRRGKLCSVDKSNVLETMQLWREVVIEVGREYPDVQLSHLYIDAASMMLIRAPTQFDVIVTGNVFGDILSDDAAMLTGSIGMLPSASMGPGSLGLFEPVHGSAPDIAGQDIANPLASILSSAMMLRYSLGLSEEADRVERAVRSVLAAGYRIADIMQAGTKQVGTSEMGDAVLQALERAA